MASAPALSGIFVPTLAAVDAEGQLDEDAARGHLLWLLDRHVAGLYPNGSTGEFARLDDATQDRILALTLEEAAAYEGRTVLAGAAGGTSRLALARVRRAAELGAQVAAVVTPYYYRLGERAVIDFYRHLAAESPIDLVLYNIPLFASPITVEAVRELAGDCPRIIGIKDSSGDLAHMQRMLTAVHSERPGFAFLTGWDNVLASMVSLGCNGGTHAAANVVPEVLVAIHRLVGDGRLAEARRLQAPLAELFDTLIEAGEFPDGFRTATAFRGHDLGPGPLPLSSDAEPIRQRLRQKLPALLEAFGETLVE